jgi:GTPase SAR1 family protein
MSTIWILASIILHQNCQLLGRKSTCQRQKTFCVAEPKYVSNNFLTVKTIGLIEHKVNVQGCEITIVDVGGQRSERKKWKQAFENTNVLVYVVAISDFDQTCYEDSTTNRMQESLLLFHETTRSPWFKNSSIIIVFNKIDLFREKVRKSDIREAFPEYGGGRDYANAIEFITKKFTSQLEEKTADIIYTTATDKESIISGWEKMKELVINHINKNTSSQ